MRVKIYSKSEFENVFGLGSNCLNWSPNTIIGIINNKPPPTD